MEKIIAHIDMNSYFATCEQQDNPAWRGHPVGVCEHLGGIIIAASIEAKKWGIKTGTPVWEARQLYPKIFLTKTNPNRYRKYTARFLKVFEDYTDKVEKYSIDEAFLDFTKACNIDAYNNGKWQPADPWEEAQRISNEIKLRMKTEVGDWIRCSVGISYSKLVAKIASDLQKPDGLVVVRPEDKDALYDRLELTDIPGIGSRMKRRLGDLGIKTLKHLRDYPLTKLVTHFGIQGYHLHSMGQLEGSWKESFNGEEALKSIGHMYTIPAEFRKQKVLGSVLYKLSEMVGARLRMNGVMGDTVHIHVHDPERVCAGRDHKLGYYVQDGRDIYLEAMAALKTIADMKTLEEQLYLIGVTVSGLVPYSPQVSLFDFGKERPEKLVEALDKINTKYDDFTIARVPAFLARDIIRDSVGFGRMKEFKTSFPGGGKGSHGRFS
ncbi:MAG: DNA polymerase IV [bacterium]|nr:DNA polymerase IV [bacterium]